MPIRSIANGWVPLAVLLVLLGGSAGCKKAAEPAPEVEVSVMVETPHLGPISEQISADAILAPLSQAALAPKISAPIRAIYVQRGAHVHAGQLLVTLEAGDLAGSALDSRGSYTAAEATYQETTKAQVPEETQKAQLDLTQAAANLNLNQKIVDGRRQLFAQGAVPGRDLDTAQAALVQAQAAYDAAQKHLQSVETVSRAASNKNAEGQLTSARGKLQSANAQLGYASLRSPINGVVTDRPLFAGETAQAGTPVVTVMDTSSLLAKIHLSQVVSQRMKLGGQATVMVPGEDAALPGLVTFISPALDPGSTTVEVWVKLPNRDGRLKAGTPVHVLLAGRTVLSALKVPAEAVVPGKESGSVVMVLGTDGAVHLKPVQVGIRLPDVVEITSGLTAADQVITSGGYGLDEGTKAKAGGEAKEKPAAGKSGEDD